MELESLSGSMLGPYQIIEALGEGGMARVYKAVHPRLKRTVALKIILPEAAARPGFRERFEREAQLIARLHHPHIVDVYDVGEANHLPYLVMQYVGGGTLSSRLRAGLPLPVAQALHYTIQMARALHHAHTQGIIHRDVKPSNMLLDEHDPTHLLLSDFGIAKELSTFPQTNLGELETLQPLTMAGSMLGTPEFMAPEQAKSEVVDARADVYALGVVLYMLLTGQLPFRGATPLAVLYQHVHANPPSIPTLNPAVSPTLAQIVSLTLAKQPNERFHSAEAFAVALEGALPSTPSIHHAPTLVSQGDSPVPAPGSLSAGSIGAQASLPSPYLTQPDGNCSPRPGTFTAHPSPTVIHRVPSLPQPGAAPAPPIQARGEPPNFFTTPTPVPGDLQKLSLPPQRRPRRVLSWLTSAVLLLLVLTVLLVIPGSPIRWPLGLSINAPLAASTAPSTSANQTVTPGAANGITDTFMVNTLGWPTGHINNDPGLDWALGNGLYDIVIPAGVQYALSYPVLPSKLGAVPTNFTVEIIMKQLRGSSVLGFGIVFRTTVLGSSFQGDACTIDAEGGYQCVAYPSTATTANFTTNAAIYRGLNQLNDLKIVVQGGVLSFSVNGNRLPLEGSNGTMPSPLYSSGQVGLLVTGPGTEFQCTAFLLTPLP